jgi:hypothetical protein
MSVSRLVALIGIKDRFHFVRYVNGMVIT